MGGPFSGQSASRPTADNHVQAQAAAPWPRWLRLTEAVRYSGLGKDRLKSLARSGRIVGFPDPEDQRGRTGKGVWVFDRESLDAFRLGQAGLEPVKRAVLEGRRRIGL